MPLFNRVCKLIIGTNSSKSLEFDQNFKITFDIEKSVNSASKTNKVSIYNLTKTHRDQLFDLVKTNKTGTLSEVGLWLYAGYEQDSGAEQLFTGNIVKVINRFEVPDIITEFTCADSASNFKNVFFELGYDGGTSSTAIIKQLASKAGIPIDETSNISKETTFSSGYSFVGNAKDGLDNITKQLGLSWHINDGKIKIAPKNGRSNESTVLLSAESGLIGMPERIDDEGFNADDVAKLNGWRVVSLLQAKLTPHRLVQMQSNEINGTFIVQSVKHTGDTTTGDWLSTCEIVEVT